MSSIFGKPAKKNAELNIEKMYADSAGSLWRLNVAATAPPIMTDAGKFLVRKDWKDLLIDFSRTCHFWTRQLMEIYLDRGFHRRYPSEGEAKSSRVFGLMTCLFRHFRASVFDVLQAKGYDGEVSSLSCHLILLTAFRGSSFIQKEDQLFESYLSKDPFTEELENNRTTLCTEDCQGYLGEYSDPEHHAMVFGCLAIATKMCLHSLTSRFGPENSISPMNETQHMTELNFRALI